jgi:hypothetical protein
VSRLALSNLASRTTSHLTSPPSPSHHLSASNTLPPHSSSVIFSRRFFVPCVLVQLCVRAYILLYDTSLCSRATKTAGGHDPSYNSSDDEIEERPSKRTPKSISVVQLTPAPDNFSRQGEASLAKALERATEDRRESKAACKQRPLYYGSPQTQKAQGLLHNRFFGFLHTSLNVP